MKLASLLFSLVTCLTFSQNKQLLFGFNEIPQSLILNPGAKADNDWFFGFPFLSHISTQFGLSGTSVYDIFADDGRDFNDKLRTAIYNMNSNDFFAVNQQLEIFSGGFAYGSSIEKDKYLSFGFYQETDVFIYFPKDFVILTYEGNANNINRVFDMSDLNVRGEMLSIFHVGFNKKVNKKFTYGFRGKIYSSVINFNSVNNNGTFSTVPANTNFYDHIFNLSLQLQTSGATTFLNDENSNFSEDVKTLKRRLLFGGNLGLGLDVGFTYQSTDQWTFDLSFQDIGFIRHSKDVENYELNGNYTFEGINSLFPEVTNGETANDYWQEISSNFVELFTLDTTKTKYTTWRPIKFNSSLKYAFEKKTSKECNCLPGDSGYLNAVGAHLFAVNRPKQLQLALTTFYYRRLFNNLTVKTTYTIDSFSYKNIGLGVSAQFKNVNFYILADNLLEFKNLAKAQSVSLQLGFNYIFKPNEN